MKRETVIPGIVRDGRVEPQSTAALPEGARVEIVIGPPDVSPELAAEFAAWEAASDEAWQLIDGWEKAEQ